MLRRTPLKPGKPLTRKKPMPRGQVELGRKRLKASTRRRDTGPARGVRETVLDRATGACERCGLVLHDGTGWLDRSHSFHHRQPRGMGGTTRPEANSPANLLLLCGTGVTGCHGWVESNRSAAVDLGMLVAPGLDPATVPVVINAAPAGRRFTTLLTHEGTYTLEATA